MTEQGPYPWGRGDGLCVALRDPFIWSRSIDDYCWRHHFKSAIKRFRAAVHKTEALAVNDDQQFGSAFAELLASRRGRQELARVYEQRTQRRSGAVKLARKFDIYLAEALYHFVHKRYTTELPTVEEACEVRGKLCYLVPAKFEHWLSQVEVTGERAEPIALYGCSFAILQPAEAGELRDIFARHTPVFDRWLADDAPAHPNSERVAASTSNPAVAQNSKAVSPVRAESAQDIVLPVVDGASIVENVEPRSVTQEEGYTNELGKAEPNALGGPPLSDKLREVNTCAGPAVEGGATMLALPADWGCEPAAVFDESNLGAAAVIDEMNLGAAAMLPASSSSTSNSTSDELLRLLLEATDWAVELPLFQLRRGINILRLRLDSYDKRLRDLETQRVRITGRLNEAARLPWFDAPLTFDLPEVNANETLAAESLRLSKLEEDVVRLLQTHLQLETLTSRLGWKPEHCVPCKPQSVDEITTYLEEQVALVRAELHRIYIQEASAAALLDRFSTAEQNQAVTLLRSTPLSELVHLTRFIAGPAPRTESGKGYESLVGRAAVLGPVLAHLWHRAPTETLELSINILRTGGSSHERDWRIEMLSYLMLPQLQQIAEFASDLAPAIVESIFAAAIASGHVELLDYLEPLVESIALPPACVALFVAVVEARRRGALLSLSDHLQHPAETSAGKRSIDVHARQRLLQMVNNPPGMKGNFRRLRVIARAQFLVPLKQDIESDDACEARRKWSSYGSLDEMVEECARASNREGELDHVHYQQTRNYLANFNNELEHWCRSHQRPRSIEQDDIAEAYTRLRYEASNGGDAACVLLVDLIERALAPDVASVVLTFGQRCTPGPDGELMLADWQNQVRPEMTWSWSQGVTEGSVLFRSFVADVLRQSMGRGPLTLGAAVQELLVRGEYLPAQQAAGAYPDLMRLVRDAVENRRATIRAEHAELLAQAQSARAQDEYIDCWVNDVDEALETLEFDLAFVRLRELKGLVTKFNLDRDPARRGLIDLLLEAGRVIHDDLPTIELERQVEVLRSENKTRREHIQKMEIVSGDELFPHSLREAWTAFARRIDRPALWPTPERSFEIAAAIDVYQRFLRGRLRRRYDDPRAVDFLVKSLESWIPSRMKDALETKDTEPERPPFLVLADEIQEFCPDRRILQLLGESTQPIIFGATPDGPSIEGGARPKQRATRSYPLNLVAPVEGQAAADLVSEVRTYLREHALRETGPGAKPDPGALRGAVRRQDWATARRLAALSLEESASAADQRFTGIEVVYAIALSRMWPALDGEGGGRAFKYACLTTLYHSDAQYYLGSSELNEWIARALIAVGGVDPAANAVSLSEPLAKVLATLSEASSSAPSYLWLSSLLASANVFVSDDGIHGEARLASQLWEVLKGAKENARPRCDLLHTLYRMRRSEALKHLARGAKPLDDLIIACVNAFGRAESDPEVRVRTLQVATALREQTKGRPNTKPWTLLFARIEPLSGEEVALSCSIEFDRVEECDDGSVILPIRLVPPFYDPPEELELELGGEQAESAGSLYGRFPLIDELLLKTRVVPVRVPRSALGEMGTSFTVPYRITGRTIRRNKIDVRGSWTLHATKAGAFAPMSEDEIKLKWPGASGNPVTTASNSFYGREREIREIRAYIQAVDRQQSVMIFGQRRIGKTSLLCQMVGEFPPGPGRVAAAFLDVSHLAPQPGAMSRSFFDLIIAAFDRDPNNEPLRRELQRHNQGRRIDFALLARGLNPGASLFYALEGFVEKLDRQTRGGISRIALFIDEFDRFVEPLLRGEREEVERLMWEIRQIAQQSRTVSLVLAGSGLQRLLVDDYTAALFGSIGQVEIGPFQWSSDHDAIERTFIPPELRNRLCHDDIFGEVVRAAYDLSGGHPYYLSILGFSSALVSNGRELTPLQLNRVVEEIISGKVRTTGWKIDGKCFYAPIFETLKRAHPRTRAIAKLLFAQLAQRTTLEYPWLTIGDAIESAELRSASEAEGLDALKMLDREGAVQLDPGSGTPRVRIRIPLAAEAAREDAILIRQDAIRELRASEEKIVS